MAPRALSTYALASKNELKRALLMETTNPSPFSDDQEDTLSDCLEYSSGEIEAFLNRLLVTRGAITEYHTPSSQLPARIVLTQFPPITFTSVDEGYWSGASWSSSLTLTPTTDYLSDAPAGVLYRVIGIAAVDWRGGFESVRVIYTAGYANTAAVPDAIRRVAVALAARRFQEIKRGQPGAQSISDGLGSTTRYLPAELLTMEQNALFPFKRFMTTGRAA